VEALARRLPTPIPCRKSSATLHRDEFRRAKQDCRCSPQSPLIVGSRLRDCGDLANQHDERSPPKSGYPLITTIRISTWLSRYVAPENGLFVIWSYITSAK
jgi:hypothetical protein